jgi:hypothetical protein
VTSATIPSATATTTIVGVSDSAAFACSSSVFILSFSSSSTCAVVQFSPRSVSALSLRLCNSLGWFQPQRSARTSQQLFARLQRQQQRRGAPVFGSISHSNTCAAALAFNGSDSVNFSARRSVYLCFSNRFDVVQATAAIYRIIRFSIALSSD